MILKMDYYTVKCDNCGKLYSDEHCGYTAWADEYGAIQNASDADWLKEDDKDYCPDCYEYDDEDNLIIKQVPNYSDENQIHDKLGKY